MDRHSNPRNVRLLKAAAVTVGASLTLGLGVVASAAASSPPGQHGFVQQAAAKKRHLSAKQRNLAIGWTLVHKRHWSKAQFQCLVRLWDRESDWNARAANPYSGAYGIGQALPPGKMASAGRDWRTNPATQIKWGLGYIHGRYGTPCHAWSHSQSYGWY